MMRRTIALIALAGSLAAFAPLAARAEGPQVVNGSILAPTRYPDSDALTADGSFPGVQRRVWIATSGSDAGNGTFGYVVNIDPSTIGGEFTVANVTDATGMADLDVTFYRTFGDDIEQGIPGPNPPDPSGDEEGFNFETRAPGGEAGIIPEEAAFAIVTMPTGLNATFTWTGTPAGSDGR